MLKKIFRILFCYYKNGIKDDDDAYIRAMGTLIVMIMINLVSIIFILNVYFIIQYINMHSRIEKYGGGIIIFLFIAIILSRFFKQKEIESIRLSDKEEKKGKMYIMIYIMTTVILFLLAAYIRYIKMKSRH